MDKIKLLSCLLDNEYHSGNGLSARLGVSRTVIWKEIKQLRGYGLDIEARHGKGYRLHDEIDLLDRNELLDDLGQYARGCSMDVLFDTESTNKCLTDLFGQPDLHKRIVLAEYQYGGKGRRGRTWISPFARGLYLSLGWRFDMAPASLNALSLASGVAVARALAELGISGLSLKWPNDLILADKKVGGILLEARGETAASCDVVIGIGINIRLDKETKSALDQPVTDLDGHYRNLPSRNRLAGRIIAEQFLMLERVASGRMGEYVAEWKNLDYLSGRQAELHMPGQVVRGHVRGVDNNGLLLLETCGNIEKYSSGEVRVTRLSHQVMR
ncbi:MAG: biotin--[acetyl-CoA-carboxylase] ligase [Gammaproteobacteria bacterium]|nr:biotin--[acetyl-CoA-carboxylase] ligase [Gammaproteobacteria bacterium]